ncbi:chemotaxis protein CheX [Reinekea sp.]|jgi:chemotaxis protein CheX|uniref:chemotaxis protein CheX n=1 Tax=Reinekea sp. TaxID=1970455 RepID=UPI002A81C96D|nr:chemotaxis protein CheX [Reinekea sp.]
MNVKIINPFVESLISVIGTMAQLDATLGKASLKISTQAPGIVTGFIQLSGLTQRGSLAISFTQGAILLVFEKMLGDRPDGIDESTLDLAGEITNMVCGGAKQRLSANNYVFELTQPIILSGLGHTIDHPGPNAVITVPLALSEGIIFIEVSLDR